MDNMDNSLPWKLPGSPAKDSAFSQREAVAADIEIHYTTPMSRDRYRGSYPVLPRPRALVCDRPVRYPFLALALMCLAIAGCAAAMAQDLKDFTSDGCSLFPDGTIKNRGKWCDCCFAHDMAYWRGGTGDEREKADEALRACVLDRTGDKALAETMYFGVRAGGHPAFPTWYRWGYGWTYGRGYKPLTVQEQRQVREKQDDYARKHPAGYCGEKNSYHPERPAVQQNKQEEKPLDR